MSARRLVAHSAEDMAFTAHAALHSAGSREDVAPRGSTFA